MEGNRMAGTAGSGGLGALAIGGIATVAVVIGGVVLMQFGVFQSEPPVDDPVETTEQVAPVSKAPDVAVVTEPANTNAQTGGEKPATDESQAVASASTDEAQGQTVAPEDVAEAVVPEVVVVDTAPEAAAQEAAEETAAPPTVAETAEPAAVAEEVAQAEPTEQADTPTDVVASAEESAVTAVEQVTEETVQAEATAPTETVEQVEETVEVAAAPDVDTAQPEEVAVVDDTAPSSEAPAENAEALVVANETTEVSVSEEKAEEIVTAALAQPETAAPEVAEEPTFVLTAPELDLVRFDADGAGLIAGRAQAGVEISVLLDGDVLDRFEVEKGGEFVSFSSIDPSTKARVVSLAAAFNGQIVMSDATFILAPSAPVVAAAEDTEQPQVVAVAQTDVTTDAPEEDTESVEVVASVASEVVEEAKVEAPSEAVTEDVAEVVTEQAAEVAEVEDQTEELIETAAVDVATVAPQPVAQPATETAPKPEASPVAMAVLKSDSDGVELVQPATPVAPELLGKVSLDIISYSDEGDVQLAGRAGPGTLVRVYLDNSPVADIQSAKDGSWKGLLSDIAPGIYTLRLDELDAEGKVLSRLETPFKRESPEVLQPPATPENSPAEATPPIRAVTVQKGDTLWAISRERYGDGLLYVRVFEANQQAIRDPDLIYPGQIFSIPE